MPWHQMTNYKTRKPQFSTSERGSLKRSCHLVVHFVLSQLHITHQCLQYNKWQNPHVQISLSSDLPCLSRTSRLMQPLVMLITNCLCLLFSCGGNELFIVHVLFKHFCSLLLKCAFEVLQLMMAKKYRIRKHHNPLLLHCFPLKSSEPKCFVTMDSNFDLFYSYSFFVIVIINRKVLCKIIQRLKDILYIHHGPYVVAYIAAFLFVSSYFVTFYFLP